MARERLSRCAFFVLLMVFAAACSSQQPAEQGGSKIRPQDNVQYGPLGPAPIVDVTESPTTNPRSVPKAVKPPPAKAAVECPKWVAGRHTPAPETGSYIEATVDRSRAWDRHGQGKACAKMAPGDDCWIPFAGSWRLAESFQGSIVFQAFENGKSSPARSPEVGPVPTAGSFNHQTRFNYVPSADAKYVTFRALLKDAAGRVVAQSTPESYPIPLCSEFFVPPY